MIWKTHAYHCRIRIKEIGEKRRIVILTTISSCISIKNLQRIFDDIVLAIPVNDNIIKTYSVIIFLCMRFLDAKKPEIIRTSTT